jgi:MFS family permease
MSGAGAKFGNIIGYFLGGLLCVHGFDGGWPSIFYVFGIMGVAWSITLFLFGSDSPNTQKCISKEEKEYILRETEKTIQTRAICQSVIMKFLKLTDNVG